MKTAITAIKALIYASGFIYLWAWLALSVRRYDERHEIFLPEGTAAVGIILMVLGAAIALSCIAVFVVRGRGTPAPFDAPRQFVAVGPYKYVRNPMYIGAIILAIGFGMYHLSFSMVLFSLVFLIVAHLFVIFVEEPGLEDQFGESYRNYKKSVNRWLPRFK